MASVHGIRWWFPTIFARWRGIIRILHFAWADLEVPSDRRRCKRPPANTKPAVSASWLHFPKHLSEVLSTKTRNPVTHENKWLRKLTRLVPASPGPADLPLAHSGARVGSRAASYAGTLGKFVPILLADEAARQQAVAVTGHELRPAFGTRETLEVEHLVTAGVLCLLLLGPTCWGDAGPHHELARGDCLPAGRARSRDSEHPTTEQVHYSLTDTSGEERREKRTTGEHSGIYLRLSLSCTSTVFTPELK